MQADPSPGPDAPRPLAFLSYARADRPRLKALAQALAHHGIDVWWDAELVGGKTFSTEIEAALARCDVVIVAWSRHSVSSDWVRDEAASGRDRKRLLPLSLDGTLPPLGFRQYHAIDVSQWDGEPDADIIVQLVRALGELARGPRYVAPVAPAKKVLTRRTLLIGGGATAGVAALAGLGYLAMRNPLGAVDRNSVAVLPFANLSGDPQQAYFSDGLSEQVRLTLARDARLKVLGAISAAKFSGADADARTLAQKLGVAFLLNGSVQRSGDVVRIAADLSDGATGFTKWSQSFDRPIANIFAIQSEIADIVANALDADISTGAADGAASSAPKTKGGDNYGGTTNVAAYDAYLYGCALYNKDDGEASDRAALAKFDEALSQDPDFAAAHAARSRSLAGIANAYAMPDQAAQLFEQAIVEAQKAVALAPDLAAAQSVLAEALLYGRLDVRGAKPVFQRAFALATNDAPTLSRYGYFSAQTGDFTAARKAMDRALLIDPLNALIHRTAGLVQIEARAYAQAIPHLQQSLGLEPKLAVSNAAIGVALMNTNRTAQAVAAYNVEPATSLRLSGLAIGKKRLGDEAGARRDMATLVATLGDSALFQRAQVLAQWGDVAGAVALLEQARAGGDTGLLEMRNDGYLDPLRKNPRFSSLLSGLDLS